MTTNNCDWYRGQRVRLLISQCSPPWEDSEPLIVDEGTEGVVEGRGPEPNTLLVDFSGVVVYLRAKEVECVAADPP